MEPIKQFDVWLADLNPSRRTEPGKVRPVVVVQTDLLNGIHPSTLICPITTKVKSELNYIRVHLPEGQLDKPSDVLVEQIRAIDNRRFLSRISSLDKDQRVAMKQNLAVVLDLE
jgi:mRNA interferase MazF